MLFKGPGVGNLNINSLSSSKNSILQIKNKLPFARENLLVTAAN